jgi:hypothetical protein
MRRVLVDRARSRKAMKRGGEIVPLELYEAMVVDEPGPDLVALDDALNALTALDRRKGQVVEMRFFRWSHSGRNRRGGAERWQPCTQAV